MQDQTQHCGYVAIVGRPNVGKSTLLNHILGMKLSITSRKPQTTRHQILGVKTTGASQAIYVDTPGIHKRRGTAINRYMNRAATSVLADVDVVLFVIQAGSWQEEDQNVLERLESVTVPVILVVNKIDTVQEQGKLLEFVKQTAAKYAFEAVVPTAALKNYRYRSDRTVCGETVAGKSAVFPRRPVDRSQYAFPGDRNYS